MKLLSRTLLAVAGLGILGGCSDNEVKKVTGRVTFDGRPVAGAEVKFWPKEDLKLPSYSAITKADGSFEIFKDPRPEMGLKPGKYVILVAKYAGPVKEVRDNVATVPGAEGFLPGSYNILPPRYNDKIHSPLVVALKKGDNDFPLALETNPK